MLDSLNTFMNSYWFLASGIILIVGISSILVYLTVKLLDAKEKLLTDKTITVKSTVDKKTVKSKGTSCPTTSVTVLVGDQYRLYLGIFATDDHLEYSIGDIVFLKVDRTGSISPINTID